MAGIVGVDPGELTLRQLVWMGDARGQAAWTHTSVLLAMLANIHRDPKKRRAFMPGEFNPYSIKRKRTVDFQMDDLSILKTVFVDPHKERKTHGSEGNS